MLTWINKRCIHTNRQPFHVVVFGTKKNFVVGPHRKEWRQAKKMKIAPIPVSLVAPWEHGAASLVHSCPL